MDICFIIIFHMSDHTYYQQDQTDYNYIQMSQRCMRCYGYLRGDEETVDDPRYRNCISHADCVRLEDQYANANVDTLIKTESLSPIDTEEEIK